ESFTRTLGDGNQTKNEFFDRSKTLVKIPDIPNVYAPWAFDRPAIFEDGMLGTIHLTADQDQVDSIHEAQDDPPDIKVSMRFVHPDFAVSLEHVGWGISGQSTREFAKKSYKLSFKQSGDFLSVGSIKLRAEETDPTMMREKLYLDLLHSLGVAAIQANWVRLYVNRKPVGLFTMTDDIEAPFLRRVFHDGDLKAPTGVEFECNAIEVTNEANLVYHGMDEDHYDFTDVYVIKEAPEGDAAAKAALIAFTKAIHDFQPTTASPSEMSEFKAVWDYPHFLRAMGLEFLAGAWDNFWWSASNYHLYKPPHRPWFFVPTDFDYTFGNDYPDEKLRSYQKFNQGKMRPPLDKLLAIPKTRHDFEEMLERITNHAFNSDVLDAQIDGYLELLKEEISWDRGLPRLTSGKNLHWSLKSAVDNIAGPIPGKEFGLKPWIKDRVKLLHTQLGHQHN
ncbi:coth-domain-containing protein, partial [Basidiobolus meristosporus CBS 931.73]